MKELYIAPEAEIVCFAPVEDLANELGADWLSDTGDSTVIENTIAPDLPSDGEVGPD